VSPGQGSQMDLPWRNRTSQKAVAGDRCVEPEQLVSQCQCPRVRESEADVVAQRTDVRHVVVESFQLEQETTKFARAGAHFDPTGFLHGHAVGQSVTDGAVAGDTL